MTENNCYHNVSNLKLSEIPSGVNSDGIAGGVSTALPFVATHLEVGLLSGGSACEENKQYEQNMMMKQNIN